jgi:tetratricopeptide (TPR) repeat protein
LVYAALDGYNRVRDRDRAHRVVEETVRVCSSDNMLSFYGILEFAKVNHDYDWAIQIFESIISVDPLRPWNWHMLAETYIAKGDYLGAIDVYKSVVGQIHEDYTLHKRLGESLNWRQFPRHQGHLSICQRLDKKILSQYLSREVL